VYTSQLYQQKYEALGIEVKKGGKSTGMGLIIPERHMKKNWYYKYYSKVTQIRHRY
jgi:hypothetical protein